MFGHIDASIGLEGDPFFSNNSFVSASRELVFLGCLLPDGKEDVVLLVHEIKLVLPFVNIGACL